MHKSAITTKAQHKRLSNLSKEKDSSINNISNTKNYGESSKPSQEEFIEIQSKFTFTEIKNRAKISVIDFIKSQLKMYSLGQSVGTGFDEIDGSSNIQTLFQNVFSVLKKIMAEKELLVTIKSKESSKIRIIRQDEKKRTKTSKQIEDLEKANNELKKELYLIKQQKNELQKKILGLIQQFKSRKKLYVGEIKKLTDIINTSPLDIRKLVLAKTKEAQQFQEKQSREKTLKLQLLNNSEKMFNEQISVLEAKKNIATHNLERQFDPLKFQNVTSIQKIEQERLY